MNTFTLTYFLFAGGFVLVVWALVFLDVVGPGIARIVKRVVARARDRKARRAIRKWQRDYYRPFLKDGRP